MRVNPDEKQLLSKTALTQSKGRTIKRTEQYRWRAIIRRFVEGKIVTVVMSIVTLYALFGDDLRLWLTTKHADTAFYAGLIISFALFFIEIIINSIVIDDFKYSFFFWLDIIASLSLIPDIRWWLDGFTLLVGSTPSFQSADAIPGLVTPLFECLNLHVQMNTQTLATSRIQKLVKSLRLIRLIRIIKLYKYISQSNKNDRADDDPQKKKKKKFETEEDESAQSLFKKETDPSKLGKALSDMTTRRVIIGVLVMLMVLPLLSYTEQDHSNDYGLRELFWFGRSSCGNDKSAKFCDDQSWITEEGWFEMLRGYTEASRSDESSELTKTVLWMYVPDFTKQGRMDNITYVPQVGSTSQSDSFWEQEEKCAGFIVPPDCPWRYEELGLSSYTPIECINEDIPGCEQLVAYARFNIREEKVQEAILQFSITLFTCFILTVASLTFTNDAQKILIDPIIRIVDIIQRLAENPLRKPAPPGTNGDSEKGHMKTQMLELTIFKIGTLLQRGFGELGSQVVSQSLTTTDQYLDLLVPGKKTNVVFSICRIRQFTETTECLQDEIIVFVNKIVKIVHECAKRWDGAPTKNFGDKYLMTWKLPTLHDSDQSNHVVAFNESVDYPQGKIRVQDIDSSFAPPTNRRNLEGFDDSNQDQFDNKEQEILERRTELADKALISAVKIVVEIRRAQDLQAYSRHPKIAPKFGSNYKTKMTCGLHVGWAIEGSIGSEFKIDALYLSPDTQITKRIEEFCETYEQTILLTGDLYTLLSEKGKNTLRLIDNITMNESKEQPREIYTFDMQYNEDKDNTQSLVEPNELGAYSKHPQFEHLSPEMFKSKCLTRFRHRGVDYMFVTDQDFYNLQKDKNEVFENHFKHAYLAYKEGDWNKAQEHITHCLEIATEDGPTHALSDYMEKNKNIPPNDWEGHRNIDEKDPPPSLSFIKPAFDDEIMDDDNEDFDDNESMS